MVSGPRQNEEGTGMGGLPKARHQSVSREEVLQIQGQFSMKVSEPKQHKEGSMLWVNSSLEQGTRTKWCED